MPVILFSEWPASRGLSPQAVQALRSGGQRRLDVRLVMSSGHKPRLKGRGGQVLAAGQHGMEEGAETGHVTGGGPGVVLDLVRLGEEEAEHTPDLVGGQGYAAGPGSSFQTFRQLAGLGPRQRRPPACRHR